MAKSDSVQAERYGFVLYRQQGTTRYAFSRTPCADAAANPDSVASHVIRLSHEEIIHAIVTANRKVKGLLEEVFGLGWKGEFNQLHNVLSDDSWQTLMSVFAAHEGEKFGKGREQLTITDAYICEVLESIRILGSVMRRGKEEESEE